MVLLGRPLGGGLMNIALPPVFNETRMNNRRDTLAIKSATSPSVTPEVDIDGSDRRRILDSYAVWGRWAGSLSVNADQD